MNTQLLTLVNKFCVDMFAFLLGLYLGGIAGSYGNSVFNLLSNCQILFPKAVDKNSSFLHICPALVTVHFLIVAILEGVKWYLICDFDLHFP